MFGFGKTELALPISFSDGMLTFQSSEALKVGKSAKVQLQLVVGEAMDTPSVSIMVASVVDGPEEGTYVCTGAIQLDAKRTRELVTKLTYAGVEGACRRGSRRLETTLRILSKQLPGFHAVTKDVSLTGVQLVCDGPVPQGSYLNLTFDLDVVGFPELTMQAVCVRCTDEPMGATRSGRKCRLGVAFTPQHPETHAAWAKYYDLLVSQQGASLMAKSLGGGDHLVSRAAMEARANDPTAPPPPPPPTPAPPPDKGQAPGQQAAPPSPPPQPQQYPSGPPASSPYGAASSSGGHGASTYGAPAGSGGYPTPQPGPQGGYSAMPPQQASSSGSYPAMPPQQSQTSGGYPAMPPQQTSSSGSYPAMPPQQSQSSGGYPAMPPQQAGGTASGSGGYPVPPASYPPPQQAPAQPYQAPPPPAGYPAQSPASFAPPPAAAGGFPSSGMTFESLPPLPSSGAIEDDEPAHAQPIGIDGVNFAFRALDDDGFQVGAVRQVSIDLQQNGQWTTAVLRVSIGRIEPSPSGLCMCWGTLCEDPRLVEVLNQSLAGL